MDKITKNIKKYEKLAAEYEERGFNYMIKHYITRIPEVCSRIEQVGKEKSREEILKALTNAVRELMLDEYEILNWVKFMDRFEFEKNSFEIHVLYIALATKLILSTESQKEPFLCLAT